MVPNLPVDHLTAALPGAVIGGVALVVCFAVAWWAAGRRAGWLVRGVSCWLDHVVRPVLDTRSWAKRTAIIAANNSLVCLLLVLLGALGQAAWLGVAGVGLGLGAALRVALDRELPFLPEVRLSRWQKVSVGVGITLNMLEPPAILLTVGLSLSQGAVVDKVAMPTALELWARVVLPMLLVAAAGEALWLGVSGVRAAAPGGSAAAEGPSSSGEESGSRPPGGPG